MKNQAASDGLMPKLFTQFKLFYEGLDVPHRRMLLGAVVATVAGLCTNGQVGL